MYCVECYLRDGKGTEPAPYVFNGKSLCNLDFWKETKQQPPFEPATYGKELEVHNKVIPKKKSTRGQRLPLGFTPADTSIEKMCEELGVTPGALVREHRKFCDYWLAIPGQRGVKLDWDRTWCNWMRTAAERGQLGSTSFVPPAPRRRNNDDKIRELMEMDVNAPTE